MSGPTVAIRLAMAAVARKISLMVSRYLLAGFGVFSVDLFLLLVLYEVGFFAVI